MLKVSVYRYNPEVDEAPRMQDYEIDTGGKDLMVLDVLGLLISLDVSYQTQNSDLIILKLLFCRLVQRSLERPLLA